MSVDRPRPSPEAMAQITAISERRLSADEVKAALRVPMGEEEREGTLSLLTWFQGATRRPRSVLLMSAVRTAAGKRHSAGNPTA